MVSSTILSYIFALEGKIAKLEKKAWSLLWTLDTFPGLGGVKEVIAILGWEVEIDDNRFRALSSAVDGDWGGSPALEFFDTDFESGVVGKVDLTSLKLPRKLLSAALVSAAGVLGVDSEIGSLVKATVLVFVLSREWEEGNLLGGLGGSSV
jgi:hypothetical protein